MMHENLKTDPLGNLHKALNISLHIILESLKPFAAVHGQLAQLVSKGFLVFKVNNTQTIADGLGCICWTNAPLGCAYLLTCMHALHMCCQPMQKQGQRSTLTPSSKYGECNSLHLLLHTNAASPKPDALHLEQIAAGALILQCSAYGGQGLKLAVVLCCVLFAHAVHALLVCLMPKLGDSLAIWHMSRVCICQQTCENIMVMRSC